MVKDKIIELLLACYPYSTKLFHTALQDMSYKASYISNYCEYITLDTCCTLQIKFIFWTQLSSRSKSEEDGI